MPYPMYTPHPDDIAFSMTPVHAPGIMHPSQTQLASATPPATPPRVLPASSTSSVSRPGIQPPSFPSKTALNPRVGTRAGAKRVCGPTSLRISDYEETSSSDCANSDLYTRVKVEQDGAANSDVAEDSESVSESDWYSTPRQKKRKRKLSRRAGGTSTPSTSSSLHRKATASPSTAGFGIKGRESTRAKSEGDNGPPQRGQPYSASEDWAIFESMYVKASPIKWERAMAATGRDKKVGIAFLFLGFQRIQKLTTESLSNRAAVIQKHIYPAIATISGKL